MIFINDQSQKYQATLKFLVKEDPQYNNIFVDKTPGDISFLDSIRTFYLAGKLSDPDCYQTMRASLKKFIQRNNFNLLVDIDSFTLDNIEIISAIIEAILEATHRAPEQCDQMLNQKRNIIYLKQVILKLTVYISAY